MTFRIDRAASEAAKIIPGDKTNSQWGNRAVSKMEADPIDGRPCGGSEFLDALYKGECERYWDSQYDGIDYARPTNFQKVRDAIKELDMRGNESLWLEYLDFLEKDTDLFVLYSA